MTVLNEKNLSVGMIFENETCYMRIGKIINDTVYIEKLMKLEEKLIWTQMTKSQFLKGKLDVINRVPDRVEKTTKEIPLYISKEKLEQLSQEKVDHAVTVMIWRDKTKIKNPVQFQTIQVEVKKVYEYFWSSGLWIEVMNFGRGEEYEIESSKSNEGLEIMNNKSSINSIDGLEFHSMNPGIDL